MKEDHNLKMVPDLPVVLAAALTSSRSHIIFRDNMKFPQTLRSTIHKCVVSINGRRWRVRCLIYDINLMLFYKDKNVMHSRFLPDYQTGFGQSGGKRRWPYKSGFHFPWLDVDTGDRCWVKISWHFSSRLDSFIIYSLYHLHCLPSLGIGSNKTFLGSPEPWPRSNHHHDNGKRL